MGIYIALGSNLGDRRANLEEALRRLSRKVKIVSVSGLYETRPYGVTDQPDFINAAASVKTDLGPMELLDLLLAVEDEMGRRRLRRWGERNIDLDLLLYDDKVIKTQKLTLPHPDMQNRMFVLAPLDEIAPDALHPVLKKTVHELYEDLPDKSGCRALGAKEN